MPGFGHLQFPEAGYASTPGLNPLISGGWDRTRVRADGGENGLGMGSGVAMDVVSAVLDAVNVVVRPDVVPIRLPCLAG